MKSGLAEEVENLGNTLFGEVSKSAADIWSNVYEGKTEVTHKAFSPLKTLQGKLKGLSFIEPHIAPLTEIIQMALERMPKKGNISGTNLLMLQGLVCMMKHPDEMLHHSQKLMDGYGPATVLNAFLQPEPFVQPDFAPSTSELSVTSDAAPSPVEPIPDAPVITSMGLW